MWVLATAAATLIAWAAVSQVAEQVAPQAVLPLPRTAAIADLSPTESEAAVVQRDDDQDTRPKRKKKQTESAQSPAPGAGGQQDPADTEPDPEPEPEPESPPHDDTADKPPAEPKDEPEPAEQEQSSAPITEAYDLVGGVVTVRYSGTSTTLVEASPESGFVAEVNEGGPDKVDVRFRSDEHESRLVTRIRDGEPDPEREERSR